MNHARPPMQHSADYWTARALETKAIAEAMINVDAKQAMLEIAALYEELASRARAHTEGST
jgi:hypothetical protein